MMRTNAHSLVSPARMRARVEERNPPDDRCFFRNLSHRRPGPVWFLLRSIAGLTMQQFKGIPVSPGVVVGRAFILDDDRVRIPRRRIRPAEAENEVRRFDEAVQASRRELADLRDEMDEKLGAEAATVFAFHLGVLADSAVLDPIHDRIRTEFVTAEYAVSSVFHDFAGRFGAMAETAFQMKVNDIWDIDRRLLRHLIGEHRSRMEGLDHAAVVIAPDLTPSQTAGFDRSRVVAIVTDAGGKTSHTAILARALGIPAVVGVERLTDTAGDEQSVIVDGDLGVVVLDPDDETTERYTRRIEQIRRFRQSLSDMAEKPSVTIDGVEIKLHGNIEFPHEVDTVLENGGAGIGLFRTEFLYLGRADEPSEEEQFRTYQECATRLGDRSLVIRTMDLGSDKAHERWSRPERNPALGCRSIRYCLQNLPMFKRQVRAILRASAFGPVKIMFPLVTAIHELRQARMIVRDVMDDLADEGVAFDRDMPMGIMIEAPSAAIVASIFAREADFFSIGTNDLVQYTLAVDRTNERVAPLYTAAHPAIHRLVKDVVRAARRRDTPVSICGEAAGDVEYTALLIGLGLRSLSMTPSLIPHVKRIVRSVDIKDCERVARKVGSFESERQVSAYLRDLTRTIIPEAFDGRTVDER